MDKTPTKELLASYVPRLENMYELVIKQQQVKGFFTHLHNYVELIEKNPELLELVWQWIVEVYNQEHPDSKYTADIKILVEGNNFEADVDNFIKQVLADRKSVTRVYYCWAHLNSVFTYFDSTPEQIKIMNEVTKKHLSEYTKELIKGVVQDYSNIFYKNDDSENTQYKRSDYQLYLEVFHHELMNWAQRLEKQPEPTEKVELPAITLGTSNKISHVPSKDIKYQLTYNPTKRELRLNDIQIAKPQYGSENDLFLRFFVANNNTGEHKMDELLKSMGKNKLTKRPTQILGDLRITGDVKTVFFPNATTRSIEFHNSITFTYAKENGLPEIDLTQFSKKSQK